MTAPRKFSIYLLLFAVLFQAALSAVFFFPTKSILQSNLEEIFKDEKNLVDIEFTEPQFKALHKVNKKEFVYRGAFYDIKSIKKSGNKIILTVYLDKKESSIFEHLAQLLDKTSKGKSNSTSIVVKIFDLFDSKISPLTINQFAYKSFSCKWYLFSLEIQSQNKVLPQVPPPDYVYYCS